MIPTKGIPRSTLELWNLYPAAWLALPSAYRNDDCLEYFQEGGILKTRPKESDRAICGDWKAYYYRGRWIHERE